MRLSSIFLLLIFSIRIAESGDGTSTLREGGQCWEDLSNCLKRILTTLALCLRFQEDEDIEEILSDVLLLSSATIPYHLLN